MIQQGRIEVLSNLLSKNSSFTSLIMLALALIVSSATRATLASAFAVQQRGVTVTVPSSTSTSTSTSCKRLRTKLAQRSWPSNTQLKAAAAVNPARSRRGLEQRREGATPTEGGMTLYVKAGPDGASLGDCPFAHYVRLVLEAKSLDYELILAVPETKPSWLVEYYDGKMPALRHRKECYVESDTIAAYLDFFFPQPELTAPENDPTTEAAVAAVDGLFAAMAQYLKHTPDGDQVDDEKRSNLEAKLATLDNHLSSQTTKAGPYLVGDGSTLRLNDCKLAPVLYHLVTGLAAFKGNAIDIAKNYPAVQQYMDHMFATPEFQKTVYPTATVEWGWGNARNQ